MQTVHVLRHVSVNTNKTSTQGGNGSGLDLPGGTGGPADWLCSASRPIVNGLQLRRCRRTGKGSQGVINHGRPGNDGPAPGEAQLMLTGTGHMHRRAGRYRRCCPHSRSRRQHGLALHCITKKLRKNGISLRARQNRRPSLSSISMRKSPILKHYCPGIADLELKVPPVLTGCTQHRRV
jgi:hypothetical protein